MRRGSGREGGCRPWERWRSLPGTATGKPVAAGPGQGGCGDWGSRRLLETLTLTIWEIRNDVCFNNKLISEPFDIVFLCCHWLD